jgi:hypothetical protein
MIPFIAVAVLVLLALAVVVYLKQRGPALEAIDGLPMTRLQKCAWWSLTIGLVFAVAIVALFTVRGIEAYDRDPSMQLTVLGLFIGAIMTSLLIDPFSLPKRDGTDVSDERDLRVLDRAPRVQSVAMILTLAAWLTFLTLRYHGAGAVPMVFVYLIFFSSLIAYSLGLSLGVLMGYRKMARYGES